MPGYFAPTLPGFRAPSGIDTSGLNESIDAIGRKFEQNRLLKQSQEIGQAVQSGDFNAGAKAAFGYGDLNTGLQLSNTQRQIETEKYNRQRQAVADQRAAAEAARSSEAHKYKIEGAKDELHARAVSRMAGTAQRIMQETDPEKKAIMTHQLFGAHPRLQKQFQQYGLDPNNPDQVLNMIISEARGYQEPSKKTLMNVPPGGSIYDPSKEEVVYSAPPKQAPLNATSQKEIFEADETAQAAGSVIGSLDKAIELNKTAYSGPGAQTGGYVTSLFGAEGGIATEELQNVVTSQVLENLKATFGASPTEGERQILLDVQGSVNKAPEVRKRIFERAKSAAQRRMEFNKSKAEGIRSGEYFNPGYGTSSPSPAPAGNNILDQARDAINRGAPRDAVLQRLREQGIDPSGL